MSSSRAASPFQDIPHILASSLHVTQPVAWWTRVLRSDSGTPEKLDIHIGMKRTSKLEVDHLDHRKNNWFQGMVRKSLLYWRRLVFHLTRSYESIVLELSGAWEPANS